MPRKTPRRHQQGDESRQRILEATLTLAADRGYDGTSISAVTEATGLPASSVYWHFKNKDELLAETLEYSYRRWRAATPTWEDGAQPGGSGQEIRDRLREASRAIAESPEFWRLGLMLGLENRPKEPAARQRYLVVRAETRAAISEWWRRMLPAEALEQHPGSADRLARFHLAVMDGLFIGVRANPAWDVERLVDLIAGGLHAQAMSWIEGAA